MFHSNLPASVLRKEGLTIQNEDEVFEESVDGIDIEDEENHLVQEMLTNMLIRSDTIELNPDNHKTQKELRQISQDVQDIISDDFRE